MSLHKLYKDVQQESIIIGLNLTPTERHFPKHGEKTRDYLKGYYDALKEIELKIMAGKYD